VRTRTIILLALIPGSVMAGFGLTSWYSALFESLPLTDNATWTTCTTYNKFWSWEPWFDFALFHGMALLLAVGWIAVLVAVLRGWAEDERGREREMSRERERKRERDE